MHALTFAVAGVTLIGFALALVLMARPTFTAAPLGRIFAFAALFVIPLFAVVLGVSDHIENSKRTSFCLSCHTMEPYGRSLLVDDRSYIPAVHHQNHLVPSESTCFTCHTDYTLYGDVSAKMRGLRHVYVYYLGTIPARIKLYKPYNNRECLHCHRGARSFEEGATHTIEKETIAKIKSNQLSCLSSGCHETVHNVHNLKDVSMWKEEGK